MNQILLGAKITFGRLNRRVAQEHLDLLKLATGCSAELRAGPSQVVRRDAGGTNGRRVLL